MGLKHQWTTAVTNGMFLRVDQQCLPTFCPPSRCILEYLPNDFAELCLKYSNMYLFQQKPLTMNHTGFCSHLSPILNVIQFFTTPLSGNVICLQRPGLWVFSGHVHRRCSRVPEVGVPQYLAIKLTIGKLINSSIDHQVVSLSFPIWLYVSDSSTKQIVFYPIVWPHRYIQYLKARSRSQKISKDGLQQEIMKDHSFQIPRFRLWDSEYFGIPLSGSMSISRDRSLSLKTAGDQAVGGSQSGVIHLDARGTWLWKPRYDYIYI